MENGEKREVAEVTNLVTKKLSARMAEKYGVEPAQLMATLKATAFRVKDHEISDSQMIALLVVADQYGLNPFTKEIYAYPDSKTGGIVPVVGVDGWHRIMNRGDDFQGIEYSQSDDWSEPEGGKPCPDWIEAKIWRKNRDKPCVVREYLDECFRKTSYASPWQTHTKRMLRHKVTIQCARVAFGFAGIYDEDEAERIIERADFDVVGSKTGKPDIKLSKKKELPAPASRTVDASKPAAPIEEKKPAPVIIPEAEFVGRIDTAIKDGEAKGKTRSQVNNEIASALVIKGLVGDPFKNEEKNRARVLEIVSGLYS